MPAPLALPALDRIGPTEAERFREDGFLVVERALPPDVVEALRERFPLLFAGRFDTGTYPDEWYWREGMSLPDLTRHMANAWKADLTVASLVLSESIGRAVGALTGWPGVRLGQDTIWWKAPKTKAIAHHQDSSFLGLLDPPGTTVTCWFTLDDTAADAGTLEYAPGSHRWPLTPIPDAFHGTDDFRAAMRAAAAAAGVAPEEPVPVVAPAGSVSFHAGRIWHGSGPNPQGERMRRSIGVHVVPEASRFSDRHGEGYIYRRYQRTGDPAMDESFFPVTWSSRPGGRTAWIEGYCATGRREPARAATEAAAAAAA